MRCPWCGEDDDRVVDSRPADGGSAIRRRRACAACGRRFSTYERVERAGLMIRKRDGSVQPFAREKVVSGISKATKNRPVTPLDVEDLVDRVEERLLRKGPEVSSQQVGIEVLQQLRKVDEVAYLRFVSVYKDFQELTDFERELGTLLKREPAKRRGR
jgi:transcriptional repressor NrdR